MLVLAGLAICVDTIVADAAIAADAARPTLERAGAEKQHCHGTPCVGTVRYPVSPKIHFYSEFDVPGKIENMSHGVNFFIYFNIFFGNSKNGRMNQFVPQLMVGHPLCDSTNAPDYKPIWRQQHSYVFGAQYFFELFNTATNKTQPHAATGELFNTTPGEILWTSFDLSDDYIWTLGMGVKGDPKRTSTVVAHKPYMGLLFDETWSWAEDVYNSTQVGSCWEQANVWDRSNYPSTGSRYDMRIRTDDEDLIKWQTHWGLKIPDCPGHPNQTVTESHTNTKQHVLWDIFWPLA